LFPRCPSCGAKQKVLRAPGKYACPSCAAPLRLRNALALAAAFAVAPMVAGAVAGPLCDSRTCAGVSSLLLALILGFLAYAALLNVEKAT